jgi:hypothetical protein
MRIVIICLIVSTFAHLSAQDGGVLDGRVYIVDVAAGGGAAAQRAMLTFAGAESRLKYSDETTLTFTYEAHAAGDQAIIAFNGRFNGGETIVRGSVSGEAIKGEIVAGADARPFSGTVTRAAADLLAQGREKQLQRKPKEAIACYVDVIEHHRSELANSAPALVYLVECYQSLVGDEAAGAAWQVASKRYLSSPPPLDGSSSITIDQAKQDLLFKSWAPIVPAAISTDPELTEIFAKAIKQADKKNHDWRYMLGAIGLAGSSTRLDEALIRKRDDAPFDGQAYVKLKHMWPSTSRFDRAEYFLIDAGTDLQAEQDGEMLVQASLAEHIGLHDNNLLYVSGSVGHSEERGTVTTLDIVPSYLHFGYHDDDLGDSYRLGVRIMGGPKTTPSTKLGGIVGVDRIIDYKTGERRLATELYAMLLWPITDDIGFYAAGAYCRDARHEDGEQDSTWTGMIGLEWHIDNHF